MLSSSFWLTRLQNIVFYGKKWDDKYIEHLNSVKASEVKALAAKLYRGAKIIGVYTEEK